MQRNHFEAPRKHFFPLVLALFLVWSNVAPAPPIKLSTEDFVDAGSFAQVFKDPRDHKKVFRVVINPDEKATHAQIVERLRILEEVDGARFHGVEEVVLPGENVPRTAILMDNVAGEFITVEGGSRVGPQAKKRLFDLIDRMAERGIIHEDMQVVQQPNGKLVPIDPAEVKRVDVAQAKRWAETTKAKIERWEWHHSTAAAASETRPRTRVVTTPHWNSKERWYTRQSAAMTTAFAAFYAAGGPERAAAVMFPGQAVNHARSEDIRYWNKRGYVSEDDYMFRNRLGPYTVAREPSRDWAKVRAVMSAGPDDDAPRFTPRDLIKSLKSDRIPPGLRLDYFDRFNRIFRDKGPFGRDDLRDDLRK